MGGKKKIYGNTEELLTACHPDFSLGFLQRTAAGAWSINMGQEFPSENKLIVLFEMDYSNQQAIIPNALFTQMKNENISIFNWRDISEI